MLETFEKSYTPIFRITLTKQAFLLMDDFAQEEFWTPLNHPKLLGFGVELLVLHGRFRALACHGDRRQQLGRSIPVV